MNPFTRNLIGLRGLVLLVVGSAALALAACATPRIDSTASAADLEAKAAHHAMMATDYRARMRVDDKHAIQWFTMANHCDQKAQAYRVAAMQLGTEPTYRR